MNSRRVLLATAVLAAVLLSGLLAWAQGDSAEGDNALLGLLRFVPDTPGYREYAAFGDVAAWHESWGIPRVDSLAALEALDRVSRAYWGLILFNQTTPPDSLGIQYMQAEADDQRAFYGFNFFNVDRCLWAGWPPDGIAVTELNLDSDPIAAALTASGYQSSALGESGTLYSLRNDYAIDMQFHIRSGMMAHMNRIALLDGTVVTGAATAIVTGAALAHAGTIPSLADDPAYRAAATAISLDPALEDTGELVGAIFIAGTEFADLAGDPSIAAYLADRPPLPPYTLVAFATRHTTGASSLILALVYPEGATAGAEAAATEVGQRLSGYISLATNAPLDDRWSLAATATTQAEGLPVALIVMRANDPPPTPDDQRMVNSSVFAWVQLILRRDLAFMAYTAQ